ncbi:HNH endonuclease signature motif containing protein [Burkholderia pseudomallei]|uniref:HNH endonuclease signature motif containing protein n=1 Tax=Burkholderia pseudomallei TaxID=28450 RepID=UPI000E6A124C|nr:HNH endonuclease signature motif containing protein [Burkholderia pseudomallei]RIV37675.1 HNH endonuclease [Burkholderia pseudomallei]RIV47884.1 HNH endonuclease [Burkholderia pseudomallei]
MTTLADLKPVTKQLVRDIAEKVGVPMTTQYDWCFKGDGGPYLVNIWHDGMDEDGDEIFFIDTASDWAQDNIDTATPVQLNRADAVSALMVEAYYRKKPIYVAILDGVRRKKGLRETSEAHQRELDPVLWYPHHRNEERRIVVIRGKPQPAEFDAYAEDQEYEKQHKAPPAPAVPAKKVIAPATAIYERDSAVVRAAKLRAADGSCELCGKRGFVTASGAYYLEAHHVIPLNCGGADDERNVVAICADDHRQAHFGEDRHELRDTMIWDVLAKKYPHDEEFFEGLDEKSHQIAQNETSLRRLEENKVET